MATRTKTTVETLTPGELEMAILKVFSQKTGLNLAPERIRGDLAADGISCEAQELGCLLSSMHRAGLIDMSMENSSTFAEIEVRFGLP